MAMRIKLVYNLWIFVRRLGDVLIVCMLGELLMSIVGEILAV